MSNIPKIRFKGFTEDWEQRKFGDIGTVAMCKRIFKEQTSEDGDVPFYKIGTFGGTPDAFISRELFQEYKKAYQYPSRGDILISASGSIGRTVEYTGEDEYFQDSNIVWLKHGDNIDNAFLKVLYSVVDWSCEGSTIKRLYNDNFLKTEFMLPKTEEQIRIGEYFRNLDNLITIHQRKYDELTELKKYMMRKMFPEKGKKVPEIRFAGFTEEWEQRKISKIAIEKLSNGIINNQTNDETGVRHINVINMYDPDKIHPEKLTFSDYDEEAVKKCNVELGDIFFTRSSLKPEGIAEVNVLLDAGRFVYDDHLIRLKIDKEKYDPFFVKLNLSGNAFKKQFIVRAKTTAFTTIGQEDIMECTGVFPKKEEQEKIGSYFHILDNLLTLHQQKLDELTELKKYMLQNMFPKKEG